MPNVVQQRLIKTNRILEIEIERLRAKLKDAQKRLRGAGMLSDDELEK